MIMGRSLPSTDAPIPPTRNRRGFPRRRIANPPAPVRTWATQCPKMPLIAGFAQE